jgi:hypothetical protein
MVENPQLEQNGGEFLAGLKDKLLYLLLKFNLPTRIGFGIGCAFD